MKIYSLCSMLCAYLWFIQIVGILRVMLVCKEVQDHWDQLVIGVSGDHRDYKEYKDLKDSL